ncbi:MAG: DUF1194 domain-containing protein [Pseudomonadota bacterium]
MKRILTAAALCLAGPATAQELPCRLALAMGLDISSSVNSAEYDLQMNGLIAAFRDQTIRDAILSVPGTEVQVMVYEWSGYVQQDAVVRWRALRNEADIDAFADELSMHFRIYSDFPTAIGRALEYALEEFERLPTECSQKIVDLSGDGVGNDGPPAISYWPELAAAGVTVNALVIAGAAPDPVAHYQFSVITGPGAFHLVARNGFVDYPDLIKGKLEREFQPVLMLSDTE